MSDAGLQVRTAWSSRKTKRMAVTSLVLAVLVAGSLILSFALHSSVSDRNTAAVRTAVVRTTVSAGLIAALVSTTAAYVSPNGAERAPIALTWYGSRLDLPVIAVHGQYLEVRLPTRPNGSTAWVRRSSVRLYRTLYQIVVNLGTRHLQLYRNNRLVLNAPAGVGTVADPTPTGHFFVAFFAKAPTAAWGPFVLVTSAHSNAISDWEESGDAIVAIHGPLGDDREIGTTGARISHGCVRLHDNDLVQLREVPDGTPVNIIS